MDNNDVLAYVYCKNVISGNIIAPKYVNKQCHIFVDICDVKSDKYTIDYKRLESIYIILKSIKMPKGILIGKSIFDALSGYQWLLITATLCVVHKDNYRKRRYEKAVLEIARKNGKTFVIAILFILLFFIEPKYSYFYSVAPDGALSREIKKSISEIIGFNSKILTQEGKNRRFKIVRDEIYFFTKESHYIPLNYSNSRLDGKLPNVFLVDEAGALPNNYAIEAMESGQLTILNKLGFVISTKYPTINNPFEDEVDYCKKVLDGVIDDDSIFALLYEPDDDIAKDWIDNDNVLYMANPLAIDIDEIFDDLIKKRSKAIEVPRKRENFLTKHCNIIYSGQGTESFLDIEKLKKCRCNKIDWTGRKVWLGVDLAQTNDNCAVAMVSVDDDDNILADTFAFIPSDRMAEKSKVERIDYYYLCNENTECQRCFDCGNMVIDYGFIEDFVFNIEEIFGCNIVSIGYDRYNAISSAQKWREKYTCVEIRQHSDTLHSPTKLLFEKVESGEFYFSRNPLFEINVENARCTFDTNMNRYVNKKKSSGKVDMVVSLINAIYLLQQDVIFGDSGFVVQVF